MASNPPLESTTAFARKRTSPVGVIANQPWRLGGVIDAAAAEKGAQFVSMCDRFGLPLIVLVDTPGFMPGPAVVADACRDLVAHEAALRAGLQASLDLVMQRLSPAEIEAGLEGGLFGRKARLWERYKAVHEEMRCNVSPKLVGRPGEAFAEAYEAHAERYG